MASEKQKLLVYLRGQDLLSLATSGDKPSVCVVYYGIDDKFNIYILTSPSTEHCQNIAKNGQVACSIVDTNQRMFKVKHKVGAQIRGTATQISKTREMKTALIIWSKNRLKVADKILESILSNTRKSRPYIIRLKEIKWFNEKLFGDEGTKIFNFKSN